MDLGPWRHVMGESIKLKAILHLMRLRVLLYGWSYFSEMRPVSLLNATVVGGPQPPLVDRTRGTMLHFEDTLFVCSSLLAFMSSIANHRWRMYNSLVHGS